MSTLEVGVEHQRTGIEPQAVVGGDFSTIGIVGTAPNADASVFPLNDPIVVTTNDLTKRQGLGDGGTITDALEGISAQVGRNVGAARCVVVRVEDNADPFSVIQNILGDEELGTGMWALLESPEAHGVTPRILIVPGYTSQSVEGVDSITVSNGGSGYTEATVSITGGGEGSGATAEAVITEGVISGINITSGGLGYTTNPTITINGDGSGATATGTFAQLANAVCAIMPTIADRLQGAFIPEGPVNRAQAVNWLETVPQAQSIHMPLRQNVLVQVGDAAVAKPMSPYVAGMMVRKDAEHSGIPSHSVANSQIRGIVGLTPRIPFSITDPSSLGQDDVARRFAIGFRGDYGVQGSLTDGGFGFWGTDTLDARTEWRFSNVVRMRSYLEDLQVRAIRNYLGRFNITSQTVQAILETIDTQLRNALADGHILDYRLGFNPDNNLPSELRLGFIELTFRAEEPPVLRKVTIESLRYADALTDLATQISIQLDTQVVGS